MAKSSGSTAPDGSQYVTITDGSGNLGEGATVLGTVTIDQTTPGTTNNVSVSRPPVTYVDKSGTITSGGTAQTAIAANAARKGFFIQNQSTGDLYFNSVTTAVAASPSIKLTSGQTYEPPIYGVPSAAISIIGATTGQAFAAREW